MEVWFGLVWFGLVWFGLVRFGLVWFGLVWFGLVFGFGFGFWVWVLGLVWFGLVWFGLVWFGLGSQDVQGRRKRRDTTASVDYGACSVRVIDYEDKGATLDMTIVLVCKKSPNRMFVCNAMLTEGKVQSCTGDDGNRITRPQTTETPLPNGIDVTVVFIARNTNNEDVTATQTIDVLNSQSILEKLRKNGMTVTDIRARTPNKAKRESDNLSAGVIAGIIIAVILLLMVAAMILFVFMRTRRNKDRDFSIGVRAILTPNSKKNKRSPRRDISMKEINDTEMRGIGNKMFSNLENERRDSDVNDGSFMVNIPKSISKTNLVEPDYMNELETAGWFHGSISRNKAEDILEMKETGGSYLVRAGIDKGEFYVTARISDDGSKYRHIAVNRHDDCFVAVCGPEAQAMKFTTFHELLEYLRSTPTRFEDTDSELLLKDYIGKDGD
ncbi:protocadherin Fat 4-like [Paramuricea clavata]|uniref:Protocadherin Fat 4-like n=1 Tax=Paramuricea clavata TaxID=317549 RepID=A0A7D9DIJ0_PARCT|nr:protocadherin Fat 4-like [Paramuricea clavata]